MKTDIQICKQTFRYEYGHSDMDSDIQIRIPTFRYGYGQMEKQS